MTPNHQVDELLAALSADQRAEAMTRFEILKSHLDDGVSLPRVACNAGITLQTVKRWLARYRAYGLVGLIRSVRSDAGHRKLVPKLVELIEGMALRKPQSSIATLYRRAVAIAKEQGWSSPSYGSVYNVVRTLSPAMVTLAHEGQAAFRDRFELIYRHRADQPNAIWQADHTELDILILDSNGAVIRPWLTTVMDDYSRAVSGYMLFLGAPSALHTSLALRQAIWRKQNPDWPVCGIPDVLYVDHGSDFTSIHLDQVAADLHFQLVYSAIDRPQCFACFTSVLVSGLVTLAILVTPCLMIFG
jgi:putative transposase